MYLTRKGIFLPKTFKDIELIKKQLTVLPSLNPEFDFSDGPVSFNVFQETDDHLILPRHFSYPKFKKITNQIKIENTREFFFKGSLRDYQQTIIDEILPKIKNIGGGLLSIPTGRGKTILAVKLACELKLKTLFIVHKTFFLEQTKEKFELFSDAKIGILQQNIILYHNYPISADIFLTHFNILHNFIICFINHFIKQLINFVNGHICRSLGITT